MSLGLQGVITPDALGISIQIVLWGNLQIFITGNFSDSFLPEPSCPHHRLVHTPAPSQLSP